MPLKVYKNKVTQEIVRSLKPLDPEEWKELLSAPNQKFTIIANAATGVTKVKGMKEVLTKRARDYCREVDLPDQMAVSKENGMVVEAAKNLLNSKGERRTSLDDL